jgi:hypothetical protein
MDKLFEAAEVCRATALTIATLKSWIDRGSLKLGGRDQRGGGRGCRRKFSVPTIIKVSIMGELCRRGLNAALAGKAAETFAKNNSQSLGRSYLVLTARGIKVVSAIEACSLDEIAADFSTGFYPISAVLLDTGRLIDKLFLTLRISHAPQKHFIPGQGPIEYKQELLN